MIGVSPVRATLGGIQIDLRVIPRSPRTMLDGVRAGRLVVRVTPPPVDHAANEAVVAALADALDVPRRAVRIMAGQTSRNKTVEVAGARVEDVLARL